MKKLLLLFFFFGTVSVSAQEAWTQVNDFPFEAISSASFVINGEGYTIVREEFSIEGTASTMYQYDIENDSWNFVVTIPEETTRLGDPFVIGTKVFFIGRDTDVDGIELWEFDSVTNTFEERSSYPFGVEFAFSGYHATSFGIDGLGYVMSSPTEEGINFASYDPETDSWSPKAQFPGPNAGFSESFVIDGKGYIIFGQELEIGPMNELWMYDPILDSWEEKTSSSGGFLNLPAIFIANNKVYVGLGQTDLPDLNPFYKRYDPINDIWESIESVPFQSVGTISFAIDDIGYVGVGSESTFDSDGDIFNEIWRLDPTLLSISEENAIHISVFPNPVTDILFIESNTPFKEATIYTILGQEIMSSTIENNQLDVSSLSRGVYLIQMTTADGVFTQKLIKN